AAAPFSFNRRWHGSLLHSHAPATSTGVYQQQTAMSRCRGPACLAFSPRSILCVCRFDHMCDLECALSKRVPARQCASGIFLARKAGALPEHAPASAATAIICCPLTERVPAHAATATICCRCALGLDSAFN